MMTHSRKTTAKPEFLVFTAVLAGLACAGAHAADGLFDQGAYSLAAAGGEVSPPPAQASEAEDAVINALIPKSANLELDKALLAAAAAGDINKVKALLNKGANADFADGHGSTPLIKAAAFGLQIGEVEAQYSTMGMKRKRDRSELTSIIESISGLEGKLDEEMAEISKMRRFARSGGGSLADLMGQLTKARGDVMSVMKELIARGADADRANAEGLTALHFCAAGRKMGEAVKLLLDNGADPSATDDDGAGMLTYAALGGNTESIKLFLDRGADVRRKDRKGITPFLASLSGSATGVSAAALLLERGADVNDKDKEGQGAALFAAATNSTAERLALVLNKGADPNAASKAGYTPMMAALQRGRMDFVKLLQSKGAAVGARQGDKKTPLMFAAASGNISLMESLLSSGADINEADTDGNTALMVALKSGKDNVARLLLEKGADAAATNKGGSTALMVAAAKAGTKTLQMLLDRGQNVNAANNQGNTALMVAAQAGNLASAQFLLSRGADPSIKSGMGHTALVYAMASSAFDVADIIKDALTVKTPAGKLSTEGQQ